jgi:hypothetical protein
LKRRILTLAAGLGIMEVCSSNEMCAPNASHLGTGDHASVPTEADQDCAHLCQEYVVERRAILPLTTGRYEYLACSGMEEGNPIARPSRFSGSGECERGTNPEEGRSFSERFTADNFTIGSTETMTPPCLWQTGKCQNRQSLRAGGRQSEH